MESVQVKCRGFRVDVVAAKRLAWRTGIGLRV